MEPTPKTESSKTIIRISDHSVRELMGNWARWRRSGRLGAEVGWPRKTLTGKFMEGMPGTNCPTCGGKGRFPAARLRITSVTLICSTCKGEGTIALDKTDPEKINPAFIRSTFRGRDDRTLVVLDRLICEIRRSPKTEKHYYVLWSEYVTHKYEIQQWKANKMGITHGYFRKLLHEAHAIIESGLRANNIHLEAATNSV